MALDYDIEQNFDSLACIIKAANTDNPVTFKNGELCTVTSDGLDPESKADLIGKIEQIGVESFFITSGGDTKTSLSATAGFFSYQTYKANIFSLRIRDSLLIFKDKTSIRLSLNIAPVIKALPQNEEEEIGFIAAGGQIDKGIYCNLF